MGSRGGVKEGGIGDSLKRGDRRGIGRRHRSLYLQQPPLGWVTMGDFKFERNKDHYYTTMIHMKNHVKFFHSLIF